MAMILSRKYDAIGRVTVHAYTPDEHEDEDGLPYGSIHLYPNDFRIGVLTPDQARELALALVEAAAISEGEIDPKTYYTKEQLHGRLDHN